MAKEPKKKPVLDAEAEQQAAAGEETTSQRAQRIARETVARREKEAKARRDVSLAKARKVSDEYAKGDFKPLFLPYKDRDGKIVPCIVVGEQEDHKRLENGDHYVDPKTRELVLEHQLIVWVFSGASVPHQAIYKFEE